MTIIKREELNAKIAELDAQGAVELTENQVQGYMFAVILQDYETQAQCRKSMIGKKVPDWAIEQVLDSTKSSKGPYATGPVYDIVSGYFVAIERE